MRPRSLSLPFLSSRQWNTRAALLACASLAFTLVVVSRTHPDAVGRVRSVFADGAAGVMSVASAPTAALSRAKGWVEGLARLQSENAMLKAEVERLSALQAQMGALRVENEALRQLIRVAPTESTRAVAGRIVSETRSPYTRTALMRGGARAGVGVNQAVVAEGGLIGRVVEAGQFSTRVLLITDINSHIPVVGELSRERAILSGNNTGTLSLDYVPAGSQLAVGERLLTSGDGGVFPPGVPAGVVSEINGGTLLVQPLVDISRLDYVTAVQYGE